MALLRNVAGVNTPGQVGRSTFVDISSVFENTTQPATGLPYTVEPLPSLSEVAVTDTGGVHYIKDDLFGTPETPTTNPFFPATESNAIPITPVPSDSTPETNGVTPSPTGTQSALQKNIFPLATLAGLVLVALRGENYFGKRRKVAYLVGVGLFYYAMAKATARDIHVVKDDLTGLQQTT